MFGSKKHLRFLVIYSIIDVNVDWHLWSKMFLTRRLNRQEQESLRIKNWPLNYINLSLEKFKDEKYTDLIEITFGVLILYTCNYQANTTTRLDSCFVLLIYTANKPVLFRWNTKKNLQYWCISKDLESISWQTKQDVSRSG